MEFEGPYHIGVGVEDLEAAMADLEDFGIRWTPIQTRNRPMMSPDGPFDAELRFVYSLEGPPHIELVDAPAGGKLAPTTWHLGYWVQDLPAATRHMVDRGATVTLRYEGPEDRPTSFVYVTLPSGVTLELVDAARRDALREMLGA
ncbi:MAG: VOC family protein [Actinobacteria bacterium]|nr:VOC family protein [Actinomycetota bacterium]